MNRVKTEQGFLLISLIIVVAIIAILVAVSWEGSPKTNKDGQPVANPDASNNSASILNPYQPSQISTGQNAIQQARDVKSQSNQENKNIQQELGN